MLFLLCPLDDRITQSFTWCGLLDFNLFRTMTSCRLITMPSPHASLLEFSLSWRDKAVQLILVCHIPIQHQRKHWRTSSVFFFPFYPEVLSLFSSSLYNVETDQNFLIMISNSSKKELSYHTVLIKITFKPSNLIMMRWRLLLC